MFRRKARSEPDLDQSDGQSDDRSGGRDDELSADAARGPWDSDDTLDDGLDRVDLGSLLVAPREGSELRLQVDEASGEVQSVMVAGEEGALELRAFAAPRGGDLWSEVRPQIAADVSRHGGTATEREGRFGTELVCQMQVVLPDGTQAMQPTRIIGVNGASVAAPRDVPRPARRRARERRGLGEDPRHGRRPPRHPRDARRRRPAPVTPRRRPAARVTTTGVVSGA